MTTPARRGRPRLTSREDILEAAADMPADELTLNRLAVRVGISKPALYRYFPNKEMLLDSLAERIASQVSYDEFDRSSWDRYLVSLGFALFDLVCRHPFMLGRESAPVRAFGIQVLDDALKTLLDAGFDEQQALAAWNIVGSLARVAAEQEAYARRNTINESALKDLIDATAPAGQYPSLHRVAGQLASFDARSYLGHALETVVVGLRPTVALR